VPCIVCRCHAASYGQNPANQHKRLSVSTDRLLLRLDSSRRWLIRPQDHRALGGFMDHRTIQLCMCLGHLVQQPRCDEGDRAAWWKRMNPEATVPLALGAAGANFEQDQVLTVGAMSRYGAVAAGPGSAAIGVLDAQAESLFRLPCARVGERVERTFAPDEFPFTEPRMDGELEAIRVGGHTAHGDGHVVVADQEHFGRGKSGNYAVWPHPGRVSRPLELGSRPLRSGFKEAHAIRLFPAACRVNPCISTDSQAQLGSSVESHWRWTGQTNPQA
jgi:hypothetical protein